MTLENVSVNVEVNVVW